MTVRIGDKEYCLDGYMTDIQKLIFDAYHQGLADGIGKGRTEAIDEFARIIQPHISNYSNAIKHNRFAFIDVNNIAEQLKGYKNDNN